MNKQITEDYVSFEIAQLLKENGFPQQEYINVLPYYTQNKNLYFGDMNTARQRFYCEAIAPTQSLALKWLRLCYDIIIDISPNLTLDDVCKGGFMAEVYQYGHVVPDGEFGCNIGDEYTYEEVVEASLLYVLKNLI